MGVEMDKPLNFKARKEIVDGKETLVIDPIVEEITYPDGRQDVIVHAPSLELINRFKSAHNIQ
jgi:urease gamma subunit